MIERLKNKIYLMIGRAILVAVNNSGKTQKVQVKGLYNETITDVDRIQPLGLETYPIPDGSGEVVILFPNGNRDSGIAIVVGNREDRPKDLIPGETRLYCKTFLTLASGDATTWMPNIIPNCPMVGAPHGGPTAGIVKLKGK
jgi:phage gp45-like